MDALKRHGWWVLAAIAVACALALPHMLRHEAVLSVACPDIVKGCEVPGRGLLVRFDRQPAALERFSIFVTWPHAAEVHASFHMQGMEMGMNRYRFMRVGADRWQAEVILPACIQGRKDWRMVLENGDTRYELPFTSR